LKDNILVKDLVIDCRMYGKKYGGIGRYMKEIVQYLIEDGKFHLTLLCGDDTYIELQDQPITLIKCSSPILSLSEQWELFKKIPACDIFWSPYMNVPFLPIKAKKRVVTLHDVFHIANPQYYGLLKRIAIWPYYFFSTRLSHKILTVSQFSKKQIIKYFGNKIGGKTDVVYNGCNINDSSIVGMQLDSPYLLFVGSIKPHKNLKNALLAFEKLIDYQLKFVIVGKKDGFITGDEDVFSIIETINADRERVLFTGNIDDKELYSYYKGANMLIMPSFYEGFGLPIVEAMHFSITIACSDIEIFHEIGGNDLLYFDPKNIESIEQTIRIGMNQSGCKEYPNWSSWEDTVKQIQFILNLL
jgi:glycosyltransferase involved in cell wall biosynthesis